LCTGSDRLAITLCREPRFRDLISLAVKGLICLFISFQYLYIHKIRVTRERYRLQTPFKAFW
jgi:hypothetical protein